MAVSAAREGLLERVVRAPGGVRGTSTTHCAMPGKARHKMRLRKYSRIGAVLVAALAPGGFDAARAQEIVCSEPYFSRQLGQCAKNCRMYANGYWHTVRRRLPIVACNCSAGRRAY
jgi:hypothetical protein